MPCCWADGLPWLQSGCEVMAHCLYGRESENSPAFHIQFLPAGFWRHRSLSWPGEKKKKKKKLPTTISASCSILQAHVQFRIRLCTHRKGGVAFVTPAVKKVFCLLPPPPPHQLAPAGETGGLEALKPLRIKRIDFKDKVIYTHFSPPECWCGDVKSAAKAGTAQRVMYCRKCPRVTVIIMLYYLSPSPLSFPRSLLVFSEDGSITGYLFFKRW